MNNVKKDVQGQHIELLPDILYEDQAQTEATLHVKHPPYLCPENIIIICKLFAANILIMKNYFSSNIIINIIIIVIIKDYFVATNQKLANVIP